MNMYKLLKQFDRQKNNQIQKRSPIFKALLTIPSTQDQQHYPFNRQATLIGNGQKQGQYRQTGNRLLQLAIGAIISVFVHPQSAQAQFIQRSFLNPSFEQNLTPYPVSPTSPGISAISALTSCFIQVDRTSVPGWETTHTSILGSGSCPNYITPGTANLIELWTRDFQSVIPPDGNVFAELNAEQNSRLFQNLCLLNNETITFSVNHRGRTISSTADVARFVIDTLGVVQFATNDTGATNSIAALTPSNAANIAPNLSLPVGNGWVLHSGSLRYTGASGNVGVGFEAVSTAGGDITVGNFIDNTQFAGLPVIELAAASAGNGPESETIPITSPAQIRVVGLVGAGGINVNVTVQPSSTAILGTDFNFQTGFSQSGNTVTINIPAGNYDGTAATGSLINIPISIIQNQVVQGNRTIVFTIETDPTRFFNVSTTTCGGGPIASSTFTIFDDDFLSGRVWSDVDNSANGTFVNIPTGSEVGTNAGGLLNAILVDDSSGNVLASSPVQLDGTYTFANVPFNTIVTIRLSTSVGVLGSPAPATSLPSGWVATSPLVTAPFNTVNSISIRDFGIRNSSPQLLLVKRITAINNVDVTGFIADAGTADPKWPDSDPDPNVNAFLRGAIACPSTGSVICSAPQPTQTIEYTVYFLSNGAADATNVTICDLVPANTTFVSGAYGSNRDIAFLNSAPLQTTPSVFLTGLPDSDIGNFYQPNVLPPTTCRQPITNATLTASDNTNGLVVVDVVRRITTFPLPPTEFLPFATGAGTPARSYGFVRFTVNVN